MDFAYPYAALATGLAILVYMWTGFLIGPARKKHGVDYPNTQGPDDFNRVWRAHQNTLEQLAIFLPSLWLFATIVNDCWAGIAGIVWAFGRILYVRGYVVAAPKRATGFTIAILATAVALFWSLGAVAWQLLN
jgi:glutathione S-transferase